MTSRFCFALLAGCVVCCALVGTSLGQTASLVGVGQLPGGTDTVCNAVSPDGAVAVGQATVGTTTQAFLWTATGGIKALPFLTASGVDVDAATSTVYVAGTGTNGSVQQALYWIGDTSGVGTSTFVPVLTGGTTSSAAAIKLHAGAFYVVGQSTKTGNIKHSFRWRSSDSDLEDLGDITGGTDSSAAADVGFDSFGNAIVVGTGHSSWGGGNDKREASRWNSSEASTYGMLGIKGLDYACGRGFQVAAGPNGVAETPADSSSDDLQVVPVGTTGLSSSTVIVTSGTDRICQTINMGDERVGDDAIWPVGISEDSVSESLARSVSSDGRFTVGRSTYRPPPPAWVGARPWQATLHDLQVRDGETPSHCSGAPILFGMGFIDTDNYSEAMHVSMPTVPDGQPNYHRSGLVVVGWSFYLQPENQTIRTDPRAMITFISDPAVYDVFSISKDTRNLKTLLADQGAGTSLTGWSILNNATSVSDDGHFVAGYGLHNGVKEGFVSYVYNPTTTGACCDLTTLSCTDSQPVNCAGDFRGMGTACSGPNAVNCCHYPQADFNGDHFVDMDDFAKLQNCLTVGMAPPTIAPECNCMNLSGDNQISITDVDLFAKCATGSNVAWVSTPDCVK